MDSGDLKKVMSQIEILKKLVKIEDQRPYKDRCLAANICSDCGGDVADTGSSHPFISEYKCSECGLLHTI